MGSLKKGSCPRCEGVVKSLNRKAWMYLLPGSVYYRCSKCRYRFLLLFRIKTIWLGFHQK